MRQIFIDIHSYLSMHICIHIPLDKDEAINLFTSSFIGCWDYSVQIKHGICSQVRVTNCKFLNLGKRFTSSADQVITDNASNNFAIIPI